MHQVGHVLATGISFLALGFFIRFFLPRRNSAQASPGDNSWFSLIQAWMHNRLFTHMGKALSSFFLYSGVFLVFIAFM